MRASDRAYAALRDDILSGALEPGTQLFEVEQSTRMGISRTPMREALGRLVADGLVESQSERRLAVAAVDAERARELFEVRAPLEEQAARLAARRREPAVFEARRERFQGVDLADADHYFATAAALDAAIDAAAGNEYLAQTLVAVRTHVARIRRLAQDDPERLRAATAEHLLIIDAILDGSESLAAHATQLHLYQSLKSITERMSA
jgi:GntR family transcriptional regulator, rspAB operon transcriptional repressor